MYILTFDIGTTSVKTCLFDETLSIVAQSTEEYKLITGAGNVVELVPQTYFDAVIAGTKKVATEEQRKRIAAVCISTQGETVIPVTREGEELSNAIVWLDARSGEEAKYISSLPVARKVYGRTGVSAIDGMVPVAKLLWIKNNRPEVYEKTYKFLLLEDYIIYRLTRVFATERVLLCTTAYFDIRRNELFHEMFEAAGLSEDKIPDIYSPGDVIAKLTPEAAELTGINPEAVVVAGCMDQVAAALGAGNIVEGMVTETTGTCMALTATTGEGSFERESGVIIYAHVIPGKYLFLPFCVTAGMVLKWFKDEFCEGERERAAKEGREVYDILSELAATAAPGCGGLTLIPYLNGVLQPESLPDVRGVFAGVSIDTGKPEFIRAIFEGVACMLRENIELIESLGIDVAEIRSFGGGSKSAVWQQIKADISGKRIVNMAQSESASLGVAILAAVSLGYYPDIAAACRVNTPASEFMPAEDRTLPGAIYSRYTKFFNATKGLF